MVVAAVMMVRNEAARLGACLESLRGLIDEINVVDTGSTDDTVAIAERFGARVMHSPWSADFSKHRNEAFDMCGEHVDWCFIIDGDEELAPGSSSAFRLALEEIHGNDQIGCLVVPVETRGDGWAPADAVTVGAPCPGCGTVCGCPKCSTPARQGRAQTFLAQRAVRRGAYRYAYPVHNQLIPLTPRVEVQARAGTVLSWYEGEMSAKAERSIPMLKALYECDEPSMWARYGVTRPKNQPSVKAHASFFLAKTYAAVCNHREAIAWAGIAETHVGTAPHFAELWCWLYYGHLQLGVEARGRGDHDVAYHHFHEADLALRRGLQLHPHFTDLHMASVAASLIDWNTNAATPAGQVYARVSATGLQRSSRIPQASELLGLPMTWIARK